ncbi:MAG: hypothetical protein J5U19_09120, partial [Candidatus Methanoperedens sp.]|nr:hypothetical protein [Candidatus Methanoperedens sp.]
MIDMKQKIKENQRKQRTVVDAFHKKIREEALPNLREKKIAHIRRVDELQDKIHKKWISKKDSARERLKASKEKHRSNVGVLGDAIKELAETALLVGSNASAVAPFTSPPASTIRPSPRIAATC